MAWGGAWGGGADLQPASRRAAVAQASGGRTRRIFVIRNTVSLLENACDFGGLPARCINIGNGWLGRKGLRLHALSEHLEFQFRCSACWKGSESAARKKEFLQTGTTTQAVRS